VADNTIELSYYLTNEMLADIRTKGLSKDKLKCLREMMGVIEMFACGVLRKYALWTDY